MAKKKNLSQERITEIYTQYVMELGSSPNSVYKFCKENNINEREFYNYFSDLRSIEQNFFKLICENTIATLENNKEYREFDNRNKLLSFYYTFFENLTMNRSFVLYALDQKQNKIKTLKTLIKLKESYTKYIRSLDIETINIEQKKVQDFQMKTIEESAWLQLLFTIKFWIDDSSKAFEKTDIFIEKSVNTTFDLINTKPLKSIIDLGKFLYKEKIQSV